MRADRAYTVLLGVAGLSSAVLIALLLTLVPRVEHLIARGAEDASDIVAALVLLLACCGIALGLVSLARQLFATAVLIRSLVARKTLLPSFVSAAAFALGLGGRVDVVADARPFSFCYWFIRPRICLSTGLVERLDAEELRAVLLHERHHLRQRDPLRVVVARYFAAGLYVIPVVDELLSHFTLQKEIAADDAAVRSSGVGPLASALYKLLPDADDVSLGLLLPVSALSVTEARIERLEAGRAVALVLSPVSIVLSCGALVAAGILAAVQGGGARVAFEALPPLLAVPALLVGPASLLFAAAVDGGLHQLRPSPERSHAL